MTYTRNSPWMMAMSALEASKTYVPLLLIYFIYHSRLSGSFGIAATIAFLAYSFATAFTVVSRWAMSAYRFDRDGIHYRQGFVLRTDIHLPWPSVTAIEVSRDLLRSVVGCCKVSVRVSSGPDSEIVLDAVSCALAEEIQRVSGLPASGLEGRDKAKGPEMFGQQSADTAPVFAASSRDLTIMSLSYGRFALFVPFVIGTYMEFAEIIKLPDPEWLVERGLSGGLPAQLASLGVFALLSFAYGYIVTLLRFGGFRAFVSEGSMVLEGGLLASQRRAIPLDTVVGMTLRRNLFEVLAGRGRLSLLTRDAGHVLGKNVVLPSLTMHEIAMRAGEISGDTAALLALDRAQIGAGHMRWRAGARIAVVVGLAGLLLAVFDFSGYAFAVATAAIPLCLILANACFTALLLDTSSPNVLYRRGVMWRASYILPVSEVQVFRSDKTPWSRWFGLKRTSLYFFSGGTRKLVAWLSESSNHAMQHETDGFTA